MEMESSLLLMEVTIKETLVTMKLMVKATTSGWTEKHTRDNGPKTKCMVMENYTGKMVKNTREILLMIREMDMGNLSGMTEENILESGKEENNMVLGHILVKMEKRGKENGFRAKRSDGLKIEYFKFFYYLQ